MICELTPIVISSERSESRDLVRFLQPRQRRGVEMTHLKTKE